MKKTELKNLNALFFRWWKDEVKIGEKLNKELDELKEQNIKLKSIAYENSACKR